MFTGIIQTVGSIARIVSGGDRKILIHAPEIAKDLPQGASVACDGICLTVLSCENGAFEVQASEETVSKTTLGAWVQGRKLNLERALRVGDELGGHIVTGHVDGVARVVERRSENESERFTFELPAAFARFVATKGSVAIDGISLTVNEVAGARFGVNIIPFTQQATTIASRAVGDDVNFEIDTLARYVSRMAEVDRGGL